jgi:hypothetical protein
VVLYKSPSAAQTSSACTSSRINGLMDMDGLHLYIQSPQQIGVERPWNFYPTHSTQLLLHISAGFFPKPFNKLLLYHPHLILQ